MRPIAVTPSMFGMREVHEHDVGVRRRAIATPSDPSRPRRRPRCRRAGLEERQAHANDRVIVDQEHVDTGVVFQVRLSMVTGLARVTGLDGGRSAEAPESTCRRARLRRCDPSWRSAATASASRAGGRSSHEHVGPGGLDGLGMDGRPADAEDAHLAVEGPDLADEGEAGVELVAVGRSPGPRVVLDG